ncbi:MAG: hypothetical protein AB7O96_06955 [Pseudobdellovibrionaceae bacterium]
MKGIPVNKEQIKHVAYQRMHAIEELCGGGFVDPSLQNFWRLNFLIAEGFQSYFANFGFLEIDADEANDGKDQLDFGMLSPFEHEVIALLAERISMQETQQRQIRLIE